MSDEILVVGAGIAGLCVALALAPTGRRLTLLERDDAPPSFDTDQAFFEWRRTGVGHLRQSHAFLARLGKTIKTEHPGLLEDLKAAGVRELGFDGMLSPIQKPTYVPAPEDADFTILTSRRTTLELVFRRYVDRLQNVTIRSGAMVRRLLTERDASGVIKVVGVAGDEQGAPFEVRASVVVDAGGKNGALIDQLIAEGAPIREESETAGILYFTRHYRFKDGQSEPKREESPPATGDLGYLKFGVFPGDNGCFSITMCTPEIEYEMRKAIVHPDKWEAMIAQLPGLKFWVDRAEPTSKVFGMGDLHSRWRDLVTEAGEPAVLGYFALGDTLVRTNPLYGRGCSFASVEARFLRDALNASEDPRARILHYNASLQNDLKPYYTSMRTQDRGAMKRAEQALTPDYKPSLRARLMRSFLEDGVAPAMRYDVGLLREAMRGFHMLEHPEAWLKRPRNLVRILGYWARGKKRNAPAYPPKAGPDREEMMRAIGISHEADILLLAERRKETALKAAA